jgi:membrane protease YdiL (CAAX protease family)
VAAYLLLVYGTITVLALVPALTEPGLLPAGAALHPYTENLLGAALPAFVVTAIVGGRDGVRDLARRTLRWRVPLRWYASALLAPPVVLLAAVAALYGLGPLHTLADNWPLLLTSFLPTLVVMVVLNSVAEEAGFTGFLFARLQERHGPMRAALATTVFFWLFHIPGFLLDTGSWVLTAALMGFLLLPHLASRLIVGWLYNATGASVLIAGLFHAMHNAMVNPTGLGVAVLDLPQAEVLAILAGVVALAGAIIAVATRRRLALRSTPSPTP